MIKYLFLALLAFSFSVEASQSCRFLFVENSKPFSSELLEVRGHFEFGDFTHDGSFSEIAQRTEVKSIIDAQKDQPYRILAKVKIPENLGGGSLRLVTLDLGNHNRPYNHQELIALLEVNPALANRIGFFKVEGYENVVWAPDVVQMNHRLKQIAREYGMNSTQWSYGAADGIVSFEPYIELLADGKFPFSSDNDVNLSVHDVMHAVSFAALNSTPSACKIMKVAQNRNQSVLNIYKHLQTELPNAASAFENQATMLASDPMERTMLLTIMMTGNYGYFSPSVSRAQGKLFQIQNKEVTIERVKTLLKLYSQGAANFKSVYDKVKHAVSGDEHQQILKKLFQDEIDKTKFASDKLIDKAAREIVEFFFVNKIFSSSNEVKEAQASAGTGLGPMLGFSFSEVEDKLD